MEYLLAGITATSKEVTGAELKSQLGGVLYEGSVKLLQQPRRGFVLHSRAPTMPSPRVHASFLVTAEMVRLQESQIRIKQEARKIWFFVHGKHSLESNPSLVNAILESLSDRLDMYEVTRLRSTYWAIGQSSVMFVMIAVFKDDMDLEILKRKIVAGGILNISVIITAD